MFKGKSTTELYQECLKVGFCKNHLKDLEIGESNVYEVQWKAFLFLRLQIFGPIAFRRPYPTEKMKTLFSQSNFFIDKNDPDKGEDFKETVLILDAIVTFTLCHFSKICCVGALFRPNQQEFEIKLNNDTISRILVKKKLDESDIGYLVPSLRKNFENDDENFYKLCYVATLLLVRNVSLSQNLKKVVEQLDIELKNIPEECNSWNVIGMDAFREKQYAEAVNAYTSGLQYCPFHPILRSNRADAFKHMKKFKDACFDSYIVRMILPDNSQALNIYLMALKSEIQMFKHQELGEELTEEYNGLTFEEKMLLKEAKETLQAITKIAHENTKDSSKRRRSKVKLPEENKDIPELIEASDTDSEIEDVPEAMDASDSDDCPDSESLEVDAAIATNCTDNTQTELIPEVKVVPSSSKPESLEVDATIATNCTDNTQTVLIPEVKVVPLSSKSESLEVDATIATNCTDNTQTVLIPEVKVVPLSSKNEENEEKVRQLKNTLKEASQTLLDGSGYSAVPRYREALDEIKCYPLVHKYEECDLICIEYAFGVAYCKSGGYDDLQKAISTFKGIAEDHSINFPVVYYGIALAYYKLNRFKEAIHYLQIVDDILQKGIQMKVYTWPETTNVIEETKSHILKTLVNNLLEECESPPPPDANCRFQDCNSLVHAIYYTDPDFKGFFSIQCSDHCRLQFHPVCWRMLKTEYHFSDKEFLDQKCVTPDCEGVIVKIENITKEGTVGKVFLSAETKKITKKKTKLEKKLDTKEEKRRKRRDSSSKSDENKSETASETIEEQHEIEMDSHKSDPKPETNANVKEKADDPQFENGSQVPVNTGSFIVFKKEKIVNENTVKTTTKVKENKKSKNTLSIDEFLEGNDVNGSEYQQRLNVLRQSNQNVVEGVKTIPNKPVTIIKFEQPKLSNYPGSASLSDFPMPPTAAVLPNQTSYSSVVSETANAYNPSLQLQNELSIEFTKKTTYSYLKNILSRYGPLREDDPILIDELQTFPGESNALIADCGGLGKFLQKSVDFAFVGDLYVCTVDQIPQAYKKISNRPLISTVYPDPQYDYDAPSNLDSFPYSLNPDAKEYNPSDAIIGRNSPDILSAISKLRQPLTVDKESAIAEVASNCNSLNGEAQSYVPKQNELARVCLDAVQAYFSDDANECRSYIDDCLGPYSIVKISKKSCRSVQTEDAKNEKESKGTMTTDNEIKRLELIVSSLSEQNAALREHNSLLSEQCDSALDNATKCQKKTTVELANLKKDLQDAQEALENQIKESKTKESKLEKEIKQLSESLKKAKEEQSTQKAEIDDLQAQSDGLKCTLKILEERVNLTRNEKHIIKTTLELQQDKLKEKIKSLEDDKVSAIKRASNAELKFLLLQKAEYIKNIDARTAEASQRVKELQDGLTSVKVNPVFAQNFGALLSQIQSYIAKLTGIRIDFMTKIDEHINAVQNGTPIDDLERLEIRELPQIPKWTNEPTQKGPLLNSNVPPSPWIPPVQMSNAGFNTNQPNPYFRPSLLGPHPSQFSALLPSHQQALLQHVPSLNLNGAVPIGHQNHQKKPPPPGLQDPLAIKSEAVAQPPNATKDVPNAVVKPLVSESQPVAAAASQATASQPLYEYLTQRGTASNMKAGVASSSAAKAEPAASASAASSSVSGKKSCDVAQALELDYNLKKTASKNTVFPEPTASASKPTEARPNTKSNSYEKLISKLQEKYPKSTQAQLAAMVKDYRSQKNSLSGIPMDMIINQIVAMVESKKQVENMVCQPAPKTRAIPNKGLINKKLSVADAMHKSINQNTAAKKPVWGSASGDTNKWQGQESFEDCTICFAAITRENAYKVECGHIYHEKCIKDWIERKSDCPICRAHLLLPEDYPAL